MWTAKVIVIFNFLTLVCVQFMPCNSERIYVNCDTWTNRSAENLTDIIWPDALQEDRNISEIVVEYGNCGINRISKNAFQNYEKIIYLSLERNEIKVLKDNTFINNANLELLKLNNNKLKELKNGLFFNLHKLQYLYLQDNQIVKIGHDVFRSINSLTSLHLENNKIQHITNDALEHLKLEYLNMNNNPYTCKILVKPTGNSLDCIENIISRNTPMQQDQQNIFHIIMYCAGGILAILNITTIIVVILCRKRRNKEDKEQRELIYDEIKNASIHTSNTISYVEASRSSDDDEELNKRFAARKESYLEPRVFKILRANHQSCNSYISIRESNL